MSTPYKPIGPQPGADTENAYPNSPCPQAPPAYSPYPPQDGYHTGQPSQPAAVVAPPPLVVHGPVIMAPRLGMHSAQVTCNRCQNSVWTRTERTAGILPILSGFGIALLGFVCGCCFIPCFIDSCMDVEHTCPHCSNFIGIRRAI